MRVANFVVSAAFLGVLASVSGCQVQTKERYVVTSGPDTEREDTQDWTGETVEVQIQGVGVAVNGGVKIVADPSATKVTAQARFLAMATEKDDADQSIAEIPATYTITRTGSGPTGRVIVACGHGGSHGSSAAGESGCEYVEIHVPTNAPLTLDAHSGNGTMSLDLASATVADVGANSGSGDLEADLPATPGGTISLVAEKFDITASLPSNFAADEVVLVASGGDKNIHTGPFSDIQEGTGKGGRGTAGTGLKFLHLTTKGDLGEITLK